MVAQFYFDVARLRYKHCPPLPPKVMDEWFTSSEVQLLSILLHMTKPARSVFIQLDTLPEPLANGVPMNDLLYKLYKEMKKRKMSS
jgi:hypothetical protein